MVVWRALLPLLAAVLVTVGARERRCPPGMHQCESRNQVKCFLADALCDGEPDCTDGSDEAGCSDCRPGSVLCSGRCARRCDGVVECEDERDEAPCPHCRGGAVLCAGRCLPECTSLAQRPGCVWRCDGIVECEDGGDERLCSRCGEGPGGPWGGSRVEDLPCGRQPPPRVFGVPRPFHNVTCGRRCDGVAQCANGWDEDARRCGRA